MFSGVVVSIIGSKSIWVVTKFPVILGVVKTTDTIESIAQPERLYAGLQNHAERQSEDRPGAFLEDG